MLKFNPQKFSKYFKFGRLNILNTKFSKYSNIMSLPFYSNNIKSYSHNHNQNKEKNDKDNEIDNNIIPNVLVSKAEIKNQNIEINEDDIEYKEFNSILDLLRNLSQDFNTDHLITIITYLQENEVESFSLFKDFEDIVITNFDLIDNMTKSDIVHLLGSNITKKKLAFIEENWYIFFKDFKKMIDADMTFTQYYNYLISFESLKKSIQGSRFANEYENFMNKENINIFNFGKVKIQKLEEIILVNIYLYNFKISSPKLFTPKLSTYRN